MARYRIGLVGCGARSVEHLQAIAACDGFELVGCADPAEKGRARFAAHSSAPAYETLAELLDRQRPDVVAICTKEHPRAGLALEALHAGARAVVLEKPLARTVDEARAIAAAARERGATVVVSHQMRFCGEFEAVRDAIRRGELGTPYYARASSYGHLMEQGPHMVDMVLWLLGEPEVEWAMGSVADVAEGWKTVHPAPAFVVGYVAFATGARAVFECGRAFQKAVSVPDNVTWLQKRVQVIGTEGMSDSVVRHYGRLLAARGGWRTLFEGPSGWDNATIRFYAELHDVLERGGTHRNDIVPSLRGFETLHAIYQSALSRDRVALPLPPGARPLEDLMGPPPGR